jgi:hypothetical protein
MSNLFTGIKVLELFAGSRSIGKAAEALGAIVMSTDITEYPGITITGDILSLQMKHWVKFQPDIIWASPPCTCFSVASMGHHWGGGKGAFIPKTSAAAIGQALVLKTKEIISACKPQVWYVENPRGALRKMNFMQGFGTRHTVTYCQYGDTRMKPTDIWTNDPLWIPRPMCKNGDPCHEAAPRGAKTGTQGISGAHGRAVIPAALCNEVMACAMDIAAASTFFSDVA